MNLTLEKAIRSLQSELPFLKEAKDGFYLHMRRLLSVPHERDFGGLSRFPPLTEACLVDVGANQGQSIESCLLAQPRAHIVSFEANPSLARKLARRHAHRDNVRIVAKGLSDSSGRLTLYVPSYKGFVYDGLASLDRQAAASWISDASVFGFDPAKLMISEVECEVDTLDAQNLAPAFIKVDVQGYEYNVLNGGRRTLERYEPVLLIESFRADPRTVRLTKGLGYEEYYFDGIAFRRGAPPKSPNSYLITERWRDVLLGEGR
jgi:FkbM family methyltransferase